ncbi:MAG: zinc ribbon domain-containing protein [Promethearchaeota archaeon]|nr:MAG: zinc ribbon domain-containing protein [Candidatus Lokiarchaeota archaeon]
MYKKKETRDNVWLIPLIAGIFVVLAILTPTAYFSYMGVTWNWWMWNLTTLGVAGYDSVSLFISDVDFIIPSIITTGVVLLSAVNLLILFSSTRKRNLDTKNFGLRSIISAVLSIGIMIYYIIAMDIAFYDGLTVEDTTFTAGYHFWDAFNPGFGIILLFLSAVLSFVGVGVFQYYSKRKEDIVPLRMDTGKDYIPVSKTMGSLNFCPECGFKNLLIDAKFCTNCGFKFFKI